MWYLGITALDQVLQGLPVVLRGPYSVDHQDFVPHNYEGNVTTMILTVDLIPGSEISVWYLGITALDEVLEGLRAVLRRSCLPRPRARPC